MLIYYTHTHAHIHIHIPRARTQYHKSLTVILRSHLRTGLFIYLLFIYTFVINNS